MARIRKNDVAGEGAKGALLPAHQLHPHAVVVLPDGHPGLMHRAFAGRRRRRGAVQHEQRAALHRVVHGGRGPGVRLSRRPLLYRRPQAARRALRPHLLRLLEPAQMVITSSEDARPHAGCVRLYVNVYVH